MPNIVFRCQMFRGDWDQVWSQMRMLFMMEGLCRVNQTHLQEFEAMKKRVEEMGVSEMSLSEKITAAKVAVEEWF